MSTNPIRSSIQSLHARKAMSVENVSVVPLHMGRRQEADAGGVHFILLEEALDRGLRFEELPGGGNVPCLKVTNPLGEQVLLLDGDAISGLQQDRAIMGSLLIEADSSVEIPVSCIEAGRWHTKHGKVKAWRSLLAKARNARMRHSVRRKHKAKTKDEATRLLRRDSSQSQGEVWSEIDKKLSKLHMASKTSALTDVERRCKEMEKSYETLRKRKTHRREVGAAFYVDGELLGVEIAASAPLWKRLYRRVLDSYVLDALDLQQLADEQKPKADDERAIRIKARRWLRDMAETPFEEEPSPGLGRYLLLDGKDGAGRILEHEDRLIHGVLATVEA